MGSAQSSDVNTSQPQPQTSSQASMPSPHVHSSNDSDETKTNNSTIKNMAKSEATRKKPSSNLSGFPLVQHKCRKKKRLYDRCFNQFYRSAFLGVASPSPQRVDTAATTAITADTSQSSKSPPSFSSKEDCDDLFEAYRKCIFLNMQKEREKQGLGIETLKKGSAMMEFLEEEGIVEDDDK